MTSKVVLKESAFTKLVSMQKMCDKIISKYSIDEVENDWLLTELNRITASIETIFECYEWT